MPRTPQDQCMSMDQYGMHLPGQQRMVNTKQIIDTNPSLPSTRTSNYKVVPLKALPHATHPLPLHLATLALAPSNMRPCNGSKTITWSTIIAMTLGETTHLSLSARVFSFKLANFYSKLINCLLHT